MPRQATVLAFILLVTPWLFSCTQSKQSTVQPEVSPEEVEHAEAVLGQFQPERAQPFFLQFYTPPAATIKPAPVPLTLPLKPNDIVNWDEASRYFKNEATAACLLRNGFAVEEGWGQELGSIWTAYENLPAEVPVIVTVDAVLHIQHVLVVQLFSEIERTVMTADLDTLTAAAVAWFEQAHARQLKTPGASPKQTAAARRTLAFFTVARLLLDPKAPISPAVEREVLQELRNMASGTSAPSAIFIYPIDYGTMEPRDAALDEAQRRFRTALAWLSAGAFMLETNRAAGVDDGTVDIQTIQAIQIAQFLATNKSAHDAWQQLYALLEFFQGRVNDCSPIDVLHAIQAIDAQLTATGIADSIGQQALLDLVRDRLLGIPASPLLELETPRGTRAVRLFGERVSIDTAVQAVLTGLPYLGESQPFTRAETSMGPVRGYTIGLDILAALGSTRAIQLLRESSDTEYAHYDRALGQLQTTLDRLHDDDWRSGLVTWRLALIRRLIVPAANAATPLPQTTAWQDRRLATAFALWIETRDASRSDRNPNNFTTAARLGIAENPTDVLSEIAALNDALSAALKALIPDWPMPESIQTFSTWVNSLRTVPPDTPHVLIPLNNQAGDSTYALIELGGPVDAPQSAYAGTGRLNVLWMVYEGPDSTKWLGAGPVLSGFEFKQPQAARLTKEEWHEQLDEGEAPDPPTWTQSFLTRKPSPRP